MTGGGGGGGGERGGKQGVGRAVAQRTHSERETKAFESTH